MTEQTNLISTAQAAEVSGLSQSQIKKLCLDGKIPAEKIGSTYAIPYSWAAQFADTVSVTVAAEAANVSRQTIYNALEDGALENVGSRITKASLIEYIRARLGDNIKSKAYIWGRIYSVMLNAVKKGAPNLVKGYEKQFVNYTMTPGYIFVMLHNTYISALRGLQKTEREIFELQLVAYMNLMTPEDYKKRMDLNQQSDLNIGIMHGRKYSQK